MAAGPGVSCAVGVAVELGSVAFVAPDVPAELAAVGSHAAPDSAAAIATVVRHRIVDADRLTCCAAHNALARVHDRRPPGLALFCAAPAVHLVAAAGRVLLAVLDGLAGLAGLASVRQVASSARAH